MSQVDQKEGANYVGSDPDTKAPIAAIPEGRETSNGSNDIVIKPVEAAPEVGSSPASAPVWKNANNTLESNGVSVTVVQTPAAPRVNGNPETTSSPVNQSPAPKQVLAVSGSRPSQPHLVSGTAKCEQCGTVGIKHAFYTKQRNYCSANCVKEAQRKTEALERSLVNKSSSSTANNLKEREQLQDNNINPFDADQEDSTGSSAHETSRSSSSASVTIGSKPAVKKGKAKQTAPQFIPQEPPTYDWSTVVDDPKFEAASVQCFKHVPWAHVWENVTVGMKVEVENKDVSTNLNFQVAFWVASVLKIHGYKVKLRFEGFGNDPSHDFWVNLCSPDVHHVGWCATKGKPLIPPNTIANRHSDWREFLVKRLTGARTLPHNFQTKVDSGQKSRYPFGTQLEIVDKMRISQLRLAEVRGCVGKRLNLVYFDSADNEGFWCHEDSALIHRCGWAHTVGQEISAPDDYQPDLLPSSAFKIKQEYSHIQVKEGMKLEAIDPLNLSVICAATIKKVLKHGYIMVRVDCYEEDPSGSDWFCYHVTSSSIFPCGFCAKNEIPLVPPYGYEKGSFSWDKYFADTGAKAAPLNALKKPPLKVPLKEGMRLEAADLMDPRLVCVATIARVIGNLLKIHFDGWEEEYDQWLDAGSPDIYPVGWCEIVKHRLELPPLPVKPKTPKPKTKKAKKVSRPSPSENEVAKKKQKLQLNSPITSIKKTVTSVGNPPTSLERASIPKSEGKEVAPKPNVANTDHFGDTKVEPADVSGGGVASSDTGKPTETTELSPEKWSKEDVAQFLQQKDCGAYVDSFLAKNIDGVALLALTKDQTIGLAGMKVGPGVKIWDMIVQLKKTSTARKSTVVK